jgi:O-antigen ligase
MEIKLSKEGLTKTGVILLLLSGLVFHDFFALKYVKLGVITITYLRVILVVTVPLLLFLYKVRIRKNDVIACVLLVFMAYGLTRIEGNFKEAFALYCPIIAFFILYFSIDNRKTLDKCIDFLALAFVFFCFVGLIELITGYHFVETRSEEFEVNNHYACGMYFNENDFSAYLSVSIIFMLLSRFTKKTKIVSILLAAVIIFINNSIICILGIFSVILLFFIFRKKANSFFRFVLVFTLFLLLLFPIIKLVNSSSIWWRSNMYEFGFKNVLSHMWIGTGIGKYNEEMLILGFDDKQYGASADPHNLFFELAGVFGIVWAIMLIVLLIKLFVWYFKLPKTNENVLCAGLVLIIPFIGLASSSCLEKNFIYLALLIPIIQYRFYKNRFSNVEKNTFIVETNIPSYKFLNE